MGTIAEPSLRYLVQEAREALFEDELGEHVATMEDLLASAGITLREDLELDEYMQTLHHLDDVLAGRDLAEKYGFGAIGKLAGDATRSLRRGFKMVFGTLVKMNGKKGQAVKRRRPRRGTRPAAAAARHRAKRKPAAVAASKPVAPKPRPKRKRQTAAQRKQRAGHRTASSSQGSTASGSFTARS